MEINDLISYFMTFFKIINVEKDKIVLVSISPPNSRVTPTIPTSAKHISVGSFRLCHVEDAFKM